MERYQVSNLFVFVYMNQQLTSVYFILEFSCCADILKIFSLYINDLHFHF